MTDGISPIKIMIVHDNKNTTNPTNDTLFAKSAITTNWAIIINQITKASTHQNCMVMTNAHHNIPNTITHPTMTH
ncbi:hypothetical protein A9Z65_05625 [Moraxella nonliquefaciens]|nr:hypothetical protein A9Z65_05625 [Moraxella nonliquefaciens]